MNPLEIVNTVWAGKTGFPIELCWLQEILRTHPLISKIHFQNYSCIKQLKVMLHAKATILFFKSGSFRIMGKIDDLDAHSILHTLLSEFCIHVPNIVLQTMTVLSKNNFSINLSKLYESFQCNKHVIYEPEIFSAVQLKQYNPIHVNIFISGCVLILGVKDLCFANKILDEITPCILNSQYGNQK
jgi:TATA-box binding protein (TBP) (component of TFIID and TFIIIB)